MKLVVGAGNESLLRVAITVLIKILATCSSGTYRYKTNMNSLVGMRSTSIASSTSSSGRSSAQHARSTCADRKNDSTESDQFLKI